MVGFLQLSVLALRPLVGAASQASGLDAELTQGFLDGLSGRFTDHSAKLCTALQKANERAWRALELALAGDSLWQRWKARLTPVEDQVLQQQIRTFLSAIPFEDLPSNGPEFRDACLRELRNARQANYLSVSGLDVRLLAKEAGQFAGFANPIALLDAEWQAAARIADDFPGAEFAHLRALLQLRPKNGPPILVVAARYFLRRAIEADAELARGLEFSQLSSLREAQDDGFAALASALETHQADIEEQLVGLLQVVVATHAVAQEVNARAQEIERKLDQLLQDRQMHNRELRPLDSLSIRGDAELQLVKQAVREYRVLPEEQRRQAPALLSKVEMAAGAFDLAQHDFQQLSTLAAEPAAQGEAHYHAYLAALEQRLWPAALEELLKAVRIDARRFAPFPMGKYRPKAILGAGGFGVAFRCRDRDMDADVVVKVLRTDHLEQDVDKVFSEARLLRQVEHRAIIKVWHCAYADATHKSRPYLVMEHFPGLSLEDHVRQHGPLPIGDLADLAGPVAEALRAAHAQGILHRDVKPDNLLVHKAGKAWQVKVIDFGLAFKTSALDAAAGASSGRARSLLGNSIAGTWEYGSPEQMGKLPDVSLGPYSDVYGFGRTCYYALFTTPDPDDHEKEGLPEQWRALLRDCTAKVVARRPPDFAAVLQRLPGQAAVVEPIEKSPAPVGPGSSLEASGASLDEVLRQKRKEEEEALVAERTQLKGRLAEQVRDNAYPQARATVEQLLRLAPDDPEALETRAWLNERLGERPRRGAAGPRPETFTRLYYAAMALGGAVVVLGLFSTLMWIWHENLSYTSPRYPSHPYGSSEYNREMQEHDRELRRVQDEYYRARDRTFTVAMVGTVPALLALVALVVIRAVFLSLAWRIVQDGHAPTTPGAAVGRMFIPLYNAVWCFRCWGGLARTMNDFSERHPVDGPLVSEGLALAYCILFALLYLPYLNFVALPAAIIVGLFLLNQMRHTAAAIARVTIPQTEKRRRTRSSTR
jgi:serine/threonine protein kinase